MLCEMCGKKEASVDAIIEGTMMSICDDCSKFGNVVEIRKPEIKEEKSNIMREKEIGQEILDIIDANYAGRIKDARERQGLTQKDLAEKVGEKESVIRNVESGHLEPNFALAKKLEKCLSITIISQYEEKNGKDINFSNGKLTIGDLLKRK